jgi:hypothetical protein
MIDNRNLFSSNTNVDKTCHSHEGEGAAEFLTLRKNKLPTTEREWGGGFSPHPNNPEFIGLVHCNVTSQ